MKQILFEYFRYSLITFVTFVLLTPMAFLIVAYCTLLYKGLESMVRWLY